MALQKEIQTGYGVSANYWRITTITEKFPNNATVEMAGYHNQQARQDGKNAMLNVYFNFTDVSDVTREIAYNKIKISEDDTRFADAIDV